MNVLLKHSILKKKKYIPIKFYQKSSHNNLIIVFCLTFITRVIWSWNFKAHFETRITVCIVLVLILWTFHIQILPVRSLLSTATFLELFLEDNDSVLELSPRFPLENSPVNADAIPRPHVDSLRLALHFPVALGNPSFFLLFLQVLKVL